MISKGKKTRSWKSILITTAIVSVVVVIALEVYSNIRSYDYNTYEEKLETIEDIENASPLSFLNADGFYKPNFWGSELKIRGDITNTATVADYKDVKVRVLFYSKTKSVIGSEEHILYEIYPPSSKIPFSLEVRNYKDVETIGWEIVQATPN